MAHLLQQGAALSCVFKPALFSITPSTPFPSIEIRKHAKSSSCGLHSCCSLWKSFTCRAGIRSELPPELKMVIDTYVKSNKVVVFMKGTKLFPQCGFSNTVVQILTSLNVPYETVNILENEEVRSGMKVYSNWPTFPQLYIDGEFFGGCDITLEAYKNGQLQEALEKAMSS